MAIKRSKSGTRMLLVLEEIARNQPIGIAELARLMDEDKSGIQRSVMTLVDAGWVVVAPGTTRYHLTSHIQVVAKFARENDDLRRQARPVMERLRAACGETVLLVVPDFRQFVVIEVLESNQLVRTAPKVGLVIAADETATARTILPFFTPEQQADFLDRAPSAAEIESFRLTRDRGYAVNTATHAHTSDGRQAIGSTNIGAPVFDHDGHPVASVMVSGPSERLTADRHEQIGQLAAEAAREISSGGPNIGFAMGRQLLAQAPTA